MYQTARAAFAASCVGLAVVAAAKALWALRAVLALLFLAFILAAALRPGIEALRRHGVPRALGLLLHLACVAALCALVLWLVVPRVLHQVQTALGTGAASTAQLHRSVEHTHGIKRAALSALERALRDLPPPERLVRPALVLTRRLLEIVLAVAFLIACMAYWVLERDRAERYLLAAIPRAKRRVVSETWRLVELKLGAFVRGQLTMIAFVSTVLSLAFWQIGLPYFMLIGIFAGIVEILPIVGPLAAAVVSIGVALTVSTKAAILAAVAVYGLRLLQDYLIGPRVLGHAVGLAPLLVLVNVSAIGIILGPVLVPLATPLAAVLATLVEVIVGGKNPADEEVPRVVLPARREPRRPNAM